MMKVTILIIAISLLNLPGNIKADFVCSSDVKYRWQKMATDAKEKNEDITVFWAVLEKIGVDENAAKRGLSDAANRERSRALEHCQKEHQNTSGCITSRLDAAQAVLARLSFEGRKKLEESIIDDCKILQGKCVAVDVSEAICKDMTPAPAETEAAKGDEKKGKAK